MDAFCNEEKVDQIIVIILPKKKTLFIIEKNHQEEELLISTVISFVCRRPSGGEEFKGKESLPED